MTTDRGPKQCTLRAGGVTVSAQAKGAGMIEPGFATMLCFVQTDAVVDDPDAALRAAARRLDGADHRRRADEHQRHGRAAGDRGSRARRCPTACSTRSCSSSRSTSSPTARAPPGSAAPRSDGARDDDEAERVARAIANSPLVKTALFGRDPNWGRIAQAAGMALAGEELHELGADDIEHRARVGRSPRPSSRSLSPAGIRAPMSTSATSPTTTSASTPSTRPGPHQ